jgi:aryl-alcohol dehydrogenase-like predicted oxidoreductase
MSVPTNGVHHDQQDVSAIEQRRLGASGIEVRAVGIGTQQWGSKSWGYGKSYTRDDHEATYRTLLDAGVNLFDTSENYGGGLAEQLIGEFHRADGRPIFLATKFTPAKIYDPSTRVSAKSMMSTLDGSLKRLGVGAVDLYQLHYPPARRRLGSYLDALAETVKVGKARAVGVSNFNASSSRSSSPTSAGAARTSTSPWIRLTQWFAPHKADYKETATGKVTFTNPSTGDVVLNRFAGQTSVVNVSGDPEGDHVQDVTVKGSPN